MKSTLKLILLALAVALIVILARNPAHKTPAPAARAAEAAPLTVVRFGMLPYGDHTQAIIGLKLGFFKDAGIDLRPELIKAENGVAFLKNGTLDACSLPLGLLYPAYDSAPGLGTFVFCDLFQGYAIMAQPNKGYLSYEEFLAKGMTSEDAFAAAIGQMKDRTFAYPSETAIKPFIDIALGKGGLTLDGVQPLVQDDALTINAMRSGQADFQVGGVPSRIVLQREGFKPIVTAIDLARSAKGDNAPELACVFPGGWSTTREMFEGHRETLLRLASVSLRINDFIAHHEDEALAIHMPYLSRATGETFTAADGKIIYRSLDPFPTFAAQCEWFHDAASPFYYKRINNVTLKTFVDNGVFRGKIPELGEFLYADTIYFELERLKAESEGLFERARALESKMNPAHRELLAQAHAQYDHFNYLDAARLAREALK